MGWNLAPAGTPPAVIKRLADEVTAIVKLPDVRQKFDEMGTIPSAARRRI